MEKLLSLVMDIAEQMLVSGAEVHRAEESVTRMCKALGFVRTDVFIITSSIVVTAFLEDGKSFTQSRRITASGTDYEKLHRLNDLSRKICSSSMTVEEISEKLNEAKATKSYPFWAECICYSVIAAAFTLFFGGNVPQMWVSLVVGLVVRFGILFVDKTLPNKIFSKFFSAVIATTLAYTAVKLGIIHDVDKVIIGNIMTLIPGIGLTNALRDLFTGDSIAGLLRSIEAVLIALAIAAGYYLVAVIGGFIV